ncbi:MAG TPA: peptidylprolyl isomerase [Saprospiraceae bacterium]|mgnify:CR=1 FL=1|nr:peptidylprolyl isomerase [Saprospiraceae bacterium]
MALIGKIRNNMWLVIVLLAVALGGFILMDMTSASNRGSFGSRTTIGEVAGQKIDYIDFQKAESALYGGSGDQYSKKSSLWNYYVENAIVTDIASENGIDVSGEELTELEFGANLSPVVQSFYRNPQTGQVDRNQLNEIKTAIDEGKVSNPEFAASFNELRKQVIKTQKQTKLVNLVSKSLYTPTWQAETLDKINNESATLEYVRIPFETIADTEVALTDEDFAAYIKENEVKYTNKEEVRNLSYVVYDVKATQEDSMKIKEELSGLATEFAASTNDSLFVLNKNGFYGSNYVKSDDLTGPLKDTVKSLSVGQVYGPYIDNNAYVVAKLVGKKVIADSAKASHILRSVANGDPMQLVAAQAYIDSIKTLINSGSVTFADAATANSQDPGSASKGGDLGSFAPGAMVPEFNDAVFNGKVGSLYTVTTQFGVHLIKVNNLIYKSNELKYNVAYLAQAIIPSEGTQNAILDKVVSALEGTKKIEDLTKLIVDSMKVEAVGGLKKNDFTVGNLGLGQTSRDIVKWAFDDDTNVGDVSPDVHIYTDAANYVDSKYVVVALKSIDKPGVASVESIKETIEPLIRNKKKGEKIKSKISGTDITAIATSFGLTPGLAENITFGRGAFPDGGQEPLVIGKSFALAAGAVTEPIVGSNGVYVVKVATKTPASPEQGGFMQKMQQTQAVRSQVNFRLMEAIKKTVKIDDNRATFF